LQKDQEERFASLEYKLDLLLGTKHPANKTIFNLETENEKVNTIKPFKFDVTKGTDDHLIMIASAIS
jgi:hypothetical protein